MEENAKAFVEFLNATEEVSEGSFTNVDVERCADCIRVSLDGVICMSDEFEPFEPDDPRYARFLTEGTDAVNEVAWLARFMRLADEVVIEPGGELQRLTLVFRDK